MSYALISGINDFNFPEPLLVEGANTENSFYTDGPSITALSGFIGMLTELNGLKSESTSQFGKGIKINGFALFIHDYQREAGKTGMNSGTFLYSSCEDKLINPPCPVDVYSANMMISIVVDYCGDLPSIEILDDTLNATTRRYNGGSIINDLTITKLDFESLKEYFKLNRGYQVLDRADLCITTWDEMAEYLSFYRNPETNKKNLRLHDGLFYAHQSGYKLLENPSIKVGVILKGNDQCEHAYYEPIINLAELKHVKHLASFSDLHLWKWKEDLKEKTVILTTTKNEVGEHDN